MITRINKLIIVGLLMLHALWAANNAAPWLGTYQSARTQGMGNAYVAVADDSSAVFYNPAGLAEQSTANINYTQADMWGVQNIALSGSGQYQKEHFGFGILRESIADIKESKLNSAGDPYFTGDSFSWVATAYYASYAKPICVQSTEIISETAIITKTIIVTDNVVLTASVLVATDNYQLVTKDYTVTKDQEITENVTMTRNGSVLRDYGVWGITLKALNEQMYGYQGRGWGLDIGYLYQYTEQLRLGVMVENALRPVMVWNTDSQAKETVPLQIRLGTAFSLIPNRLLVATDITKQDNRDAELHGGLEYWVLRNDLFDFAFRGGLEPQAFSLGMTLRLSAVSFDYVYCNSEYDDLGQIHKVSVQYVF